jgi:hypothetical protein
MQELKKCDRILFKGRNPGERSRIWNRAGESINGKESIFKEIR